jgi:serine/threonine-protein kinase
MADSPPSEGAGPTKESTDPRIGTVLADRYRLNRLLGRGGMGKVYAAEHVLMHKRLAVKVLHRDLTRVPEVVARFEREAMAAANIDHPNVAAATDFGKLPDGAVFLVLEYVQGRSLREAIDAGPMPATRALHIAHQIASTLAAAHQLDIVHRDLKPENVMLVEKGGDTDFVKVLDFGIAKVPFSEVSERGSLRPGEKITKAGMVFGTPEYMAPEQALGQAVDGRADLYSLGIITFEMLAGVRPYISATQVGILGQQLSFPVPRVSDRAPDVSVPPQVEVLLQKLLQKEASERYASAEQVVEAIEQLRSAAPGRGRHLFTLASGTSSDAGQVRAPLSAPGPVPPPRLPPPPRPQLPKSPSPSQQAASSPASPQQPLEKLDASSLIGALARGSIGDDLSRSAGQPGSEESILDLSESSGLAEISEQLEISPKVSELSQPVEAAGSGGSSETPSADDRPSPKVEPLPELVARAKSRVGPIPLAAVALVALVVVGGLVYGIGGLIGDKTPESLEPAESPSASQAPSQPPSRTESPTPTPPQAAPAEIASAVVAGVGELRRLAAKYPKDAHVQLALAKALRKSGQFGQVVDAVVRALALNPKMVDDGEIATLLWQAVQKRESRQKAFSLLRGPMGAKGADIAYDLVTTSGIQDSVKNQADKLLTGKAFDAAASDALKVAVALRTADDCEAQKALLPRARAQGDSRSARILRGWRNSDCWKNNQEIASAIRETASRRRR